MIHRRTSRRASLLAAAAILGFMSFTGPAHAHPEGVTLSSLWVAEQGVLLEYIVPDRFFADGPTDSAARTELVVRGFEISRDAAACPLVGEARVWRLADIGSRRYEMHFDCGSAPESLSLRYRLAEGADPGHENFLQISLAGRQWSHTLTPDQPELSIPVAKIALEAGRPLDAGLPQQATLAPGPVGFVALGMEHILFGLDHVAFLIGLFLVSMGVRSLLAIVSAFTIGHTITLSLATLGVYSPAPWIAESVIALSVVYLGVENLLALHRNRAQADGSSAASPVARHRWVVALAFGLIHGFGFSYFLRQLGLPEGSVATSLLGFNAGVELGQLLIVAALVPLLHLLWRRLSYAPVSALLSAGITAIGTWWLIERTLLA